MRLRPVRPRRLRPIRALRRAMTSRHWCFTCYDLELVDRLREKLPERVRYLVCQVEEGTDTHRRHLQGYVEITAPVRRRQVGELLGVPGLHLEPRRGSRDQARAYCQKPETRVDGPWEFGTWIAGQGTRSDLEAVRQLVESGVGELDIAQQHFDVWCKHHRAIQRYRHLRNGSRHVLRQVRVILILGPSGSGKSWAAFHDYPDAYRLAPPNLAGGAVWFDGYDGQETLVIDDFDGWIPYRRLLTLLDPYPCQLPVKGGSTYAGWTTVVITSIKPVECWYPGDRTDELDRRIGERRTLSARVPVVQPSGQPV